MLLISSLVSLKEEDTARQPHPSKLYGNYQLIWMTFQPVYPGWLLYSKLFKNCKGYWGGRSWMNLPRRESSRNHDGGLTNSDLESYVILSCIQIRRQNGDILQIAIDRLLSCDRCSRWWCSVSPFFRITLRFRWERDKKNWDVIVCI